MAKLAHALRIESGNGVRALTIQEQRAALRPARCRYSVTRRDGARSGSGRCAAAFLIALGVNIQRTRLALDDLGANDHLLDAFKPRQIEQDRKSTRLNSSHIPLSRMPSSA